jgi:ABC-type transport system involved in multi-copper enzyme maturation permease subunit
MNTNSIRSEWLKTIKRPLTLWVIGILLTIVFIQPPIMTGLSRYFVIDTSQGLAIYAGELPEEAILIGQQIRQQMTLPGAIPVALDTATGMGRVLLVVLAAALVGSEYTWGTARHLVGRTRDRLSFVGGKLVVLGGLILLITIAGLAVGTVSGGGITPIFSDGFSADFLTPGLFLRIPVGLFFATMSVLPYALLAFTLALVTRSTVAGVSIGLLVVLLGEPIFAAILASLPEPWNGLVHYLPYSAVRVLGDWMGTLIGGAAPEHVLRAVVVLIGYTLALSGLALASFRRRELTS